MKDRHTIRNSIHHCHSFVAVVECRLVVEVVVHILVEVGIHRRLVVVVEDTAKYYPKSVYIYTIYNYLKILTYDIVYYSLLRYVFKKKNSVNADSKKKKNKKCKKRTPSSIYIVHILTAPFSIQMYMLILPRM